ncbi:MAG: HIT domain-containing protein [Acidobacteria bacterium]|nr:HIT domain-containing protein [Acidobacteriota bacterium]
MDRLFSPWRHSYVTRASNESGCVFCDAPANDQGRALVIHEGRTGFVILNLYPYNNGHLMVAPRRHVATLAGLAPDERLELIELTRRAEMALTEAYRPQGINVGMNLGHSAGAGIADHLHMHVVPRWTGDTNFMSVVGQVRVLPEELPHTAARLRPIFAKVSE